MVKALVTGHTGFLGKNLVPELEKQGTTVIGYSSKEGNDILDASRLWQASRNVDVVYHLAAYAKPAESLQNPGLAVDVNVRGTLNVLEACRKNNFLLVYPSSCEIYGDSMEPIIEQHELNPPNPYAASKAAADRLCYSFARTYKIKVATLRLFNPYGAHQQLNKIIPTFYSQAIGDKPITVYGQGTDTRDYTHINDITRALLMAHKLPSGETVNLCTGNALTNMQVAKMVKEKTQSSSPILTAEYPALFGGIRHQVGSNSKAKQLIGWEPKTKFEDGLDKTINWLKTLPTEVLAS
jgi:nucleoside-diphosphate-sugar epimerase